MGTTSRRRAGGATETRMPGMTRNWARASDETVNKTSDRVKMSFHMERILPRNQKNSIPATT